jgi:hypothetical protein
MVSVMRMKRDLAEQVWDEMRTAVNVGEPFVRLGRVVVLLHRVLREAKKRFAFEMRGFRLEGKWLTFYIKPVDGLKLPKIMQWMMNGVHDELCSLSRRSRYGSTCGRRGRGAFVFFGFFWGRERNIGTGLRFWRGSRLWTRKR